MPGFMVAALVVVSGSILVGMDWKDICAATQRPRSSTTAAVALGIAGWMHLRCVPFVRRQVRGAWRHGFCSPGSGHAHRRFRQWHAQDWYFWFSLLALCSLLSSLGPDALHDGRSEPEGLFRGDAVAAHQGHLHPCRGAEPYSHGRDSPVLVHLVVDVPVVFFNIPVVALRPSPKVQTPLRTVFPRMHVDEVVDAPILKVVQVSVRSCRGAEAFSPWSRRLVGPSRFPVAPPHGDRCPCCAGLSGFPRSFTSLSWS